jgi:FO synthase
MTSLADDGAIAAAARLRDAGFGIVQTYSRKVFIPVTRLCRDVCHYCTFAHPPRRGEAAYLSLDEVLAVARAGAEAGCTEALFTLGDKPELRYRTARDELARLGHATTLAYVAELAAAVLAETGLLPHINAGVMDAEETAMLRRVSASQGLMLESAADRLCERGGPHFGSPDKRPAARLETIRIAGELAVPFTSGLLIGIGETRDERLATLDALGELHARHGHIQEIIVQNFRAKPGTRMAAADEPDLAELMWTIAQARLRLGSGMNIQAPPNLSARDYGRLIEAGINDWGGVSPVTRDHVNPEAPWPQIEALKAETAARGKALVARLPVYPAYLREARRWIDPAVLPHVLKLADGAGYARDDRWAPGGHGTLSAPIVISTESDRRVAAALAAVAAGDDLDHDGVLALLEARGGDVARICEAADDLRREVNGDTVSYAVNRNINYTNICAYACRFCAFSKGSTRSLRGAAYDLDLDEVTRRVVEAWERGATEVCMQGGIHPDYDGNTYLDLCRAVKQAVPAMHIHAFSPLEVTHGATTLGCSIPQFLERLRAAGLGTLPGTAAEILDDEVRAILCPDKLNTREWLDVIGAAHEIGLRTTATIMFGHVERPEHIARHLLRIRALQQRTGGFTEFVPLPFVHMEAPISLRGQSRVGPTFREVLLMHAVARLALHPSITNIQASWTKLGPEGVRRCLDAGVNDLGGTLMNESISRAAGAAFGQELPPERMEALIRGAGRTPRQRTTLYADAAPERRDASFGAAPLAPVVLTPPARRRELQPAE